MNSTLSCKGVEMIERMNPTESSQIVKNSWLCTAWGSRPSKSLEYTKNLNFWGVKNGGKIKAYHATDTNPSESESLRFLREPDRVVSIQAVAPRDHYRVRPCRHRPVKFWSLRFLRATTCVVSRGPQGFGYLGVHL